MLSHVPLSLRQTLLEFSQQRCADCLSDTMYITWPSLDQMHHLRSHPQTLPTKFAIVGVEPNQVTDAESHATQFATNFVRVFTATMCRLPLWYHVHHLTITWPNALPEVTPSNCLTKFVAIWVSHDLPSVSWLVSTATIANFVGSVCGCDLGFLASYPYSLWHVARWKAK